MLERVVVLRFTHAHKDVLLLGLALRHVEFDKWKGMEDINAMMVESMQNRTGAKYTMASTEQPPDR